MDPFSDFFTKLGAGFASLTPARKLSLALAAFITMAGIGFLVYWTGQVEYRVLFSNLSSEDAGSIVNKLQDKKVPYKLSPAADIISVPAERVAELRLEMATAGLPQGGGVGFEIFDTKSLGATEFEQQLNYRRALQGELARTINSLEEIQQSRVHLALPRESLFLGQQKKSTASVTVKLKQGKTLRASQVEGIAHLVASSVEGVSPEDVIIVDSKGNILSNSPGDDKLAKMTNSQAEYQKNVEKDIMGRIQSLLENVVGKGKAAVRVSADLDFRVAEKTEENYDPESPVVRSIKRQTEKATAPLPAAKTAAESSGQEKLDETINYEINKVVNKTVMPVGEIRKLSVAVLLDGIYSKNEKGVEVYQPRVKKDLEALEDLVKKAGGMNASRGDQVVVTEMPFSRVEASPEPFAAKPPWQEQLVLFVPLIKYGLLFAMLIFVLIFFARPLIKGILAREAGGRRERLQELPAGGSPVPAEAGVRAYRVAEAGGEQAFTERDMAHQLAGADAKKFADVLRVWLK